MARFSFALAALAFAAAVSGETEKTIRQACVDLNGQTKVEGQTWHEGVNGCLSLTCTNGVAVGTDSCTCTYPDGTVGKSGDAWYSIPTCQTCQCNQALITCDTLLNCILPEVATSVPVVVTTVVTQSVAPTNTVAAYTCPGPDGLVMGPGDMYIEGCMNCTCTPAGLACVGMVVCPVTPTVEVSAGQCFMGWLGFLESEVGNSYVPNGYVFVDGCNSCACTSGQFVCMYTCTDNQFGGTVTVTEYPTAVLPTPSIPDDEGAALDCDVGVGIVVNGDPYTNECMAACVCVDGELLCEECGLSSSMNTPTTTAVVQPTTSYVCVATDGSQVGNGESYMAKECTNCTCINGVFTCIQTCNRDCTDSSGEVTLHGKSTSTTCLDCKCFDATLTCTNKCDGEVCKVPNSSTTIAAGESKNLDKCTWCQCTDSVLLQCRDKCPRDTSCVCDGRVLRSGKTRTANCEKCACENGELTCEDSC